MIGRSDCGKLLRAKRFSAVQKDAVIRVYDEAGNVTETHEHAGEFKRVVRVAHETKSRRAVEA
jgi:hypothetical protein